MDATQDPADQAASVAAFCADMRTALARRALLAALQQDLPTPVWATLGLRVATGADGAAVGRFHLNGQTYTVRHCPAGPGTLAGWIIACPRQSSVTLVVRHLQDALLFLVGAIELEDPLAEPLPLPCVA